MEHKPIEVLLKKFWEGKSSLSEEKRIREFFQKEEIPPHLKKEAVLFQYYENSGKINMEDPALEARISHHEQDSNNSYTLPWMKIAATLLLLLISSYGLYQFNKSDQHQNALAENTTTIEDPEVAYEKTKKALLLVSNKLNAADPYTNELGKLNEVKSLFK